MSRNTDQTPTIDNPLPGPQLPEPKVPETLRGPIGVLWKSLGGLSWGIPDGTPRNIGGGQSVGFRMLTGELVGIYTSPAGTFVVSSRMQAAWGRFGGNAGALGFPASAELNAHAGGRYQHFQGGMVVWHPSTGAFVVKGAILAKYTALGGSLWGYPITDEGTTAGNIGWFNHFRNVDNGGELSIYSTPQSGTVAIYGLIRQKWAAMGWERSPLGYPTQDEWPTGVDPHGRFSAFQNGYIVYHPSVGTFATFGEISARYRDLGGAAFGYPTTDVTNLRAGGQYLHLRNLGVGDDRSIYWHPATGAHEVSGLVRRKWSELGWEKGHLGFPTDAPKPYTAPNTDSGSTAQQFQGGLLISQPRKGTYTSPMVWTKRIDAGGFSGEVRLTASDDGTVTLGGYVRSDVLAGFKYLVKATVVATNDHAVVLSDRGSVSGTHGTDEKDALFASIQSDIVRGHFDRFAQGTMTVDHRHDNLLTGALGDVLEGIVTWGAGMLAITPGVGLVIVAGVELGSLISSGSFVPGAQIIGGTLWLAGRPVWSSRSPPRAWWRWPPTTGRSATTSTRWPTWSSRAPCRPSRRSGSPTAPVRATPSTPFRDSTGRSCSTSARTGSTRSPRTPRTSSPTGNSSSTS